MRTVIHFCTIAAIWCSSSAAATVSARWEQLSPLIVKRPMRIVQKNGTAVEGKAVSVKATGITVRTNGGGDPQRRELIVPPDQIRKLYMRKGRGVGRTVGIVAAVVGAAGLGVVGGAGAALDAKDAAIVGFTGAAGAAAAGAVLAATGGDKWTEIRIEDAP